MIQPILYVKCTQVAKHTPLGHNNEHIMCFVEAIIVLHNIYGHLKKKRTKSIRSIIFVVGTGAGDLELEAIHFD